MSTGPSQQTETVVPRGGAGEKEILRGGGERSRVRSRELA